MKTAPDREKARQWLTVQLEALHELRTAGPRNPAFREWRQTTLEIAERIWPNQPSKIKRFRRIPFQTSSAKEDDRATRNAFEKGCAEARRLLLLWIAEINLHGVLQGDRERRGVSEDIEAMAAAEMEPDDGSPQGPRAGGGSRAGGSGGGPRAERADESTSGTRRPPHRGILPGMTPPPESGDRFAIVKISASRARAEATKLPPELDDDEQSRLAEAERDDSRKSKSTGRKSKPRLRDMLDLDGVVRGPQRLVAKDDERQSDPRTSIPTVRGGGRVPASPSSGDFTIERMERPKSQNKGPDALERMIDQAMERARGGDRPRAKAGAGRAPSSPTPPRREEVEREIPREAPIAEIPMEDVPSATPQAAQPPAPAPVAAQPPAQPAPVAAAPVAPPAPVAAAPIAPPAPVAAQPPAQPVPPAPPAPAPVASAPPREHEPLPVESVTAALDAAIDGLTPREPAPTLAVESLATKAAEAGATAPVDEISIVPIRHRAEASSDVVEVIMGLATDLGGRGVPDDERRRVRAALLEVARLVDTGTLTWAALEEAVARAMRYPKLARELVPLLLQYFDTAA